MTIRTAAFFLFGLGVAVGLTNVAVTTLDGQTGWGPLLSGGLLLAGVGLLAWERVRDGEG